MSQVRLFLAIVWLGLGGYALFVQELPGRLGPYAGWFALLFGLYNGMRWWTDLPRGLPPPPPHRRRRAHDRPPPRLDVYHPEFDFAKNDPEQPRGV